MIGLQRRHIDWDTASLEELDAERDSLAATIGRVRDEMAAARERRLNTGVLVDPLWWEQREDLLRRLTRKLSVLEGKLAKRVDRLGRVAVAAGGPVVRKRTAGAGAGWVANPLRFVAVARELLDGETFRVIAELAAGDQ